MSAYEQHRADMRTGDLILFSGNGFISRGIQAITGSPWSHVAVVLHVPLYDFLCSFESTTLSDIPDLTTGKPIKGVHLVPLSQRIATYDGDLIAWRRVDGPRTASAIHAALNVRSEFAGRPYETNQLELLRSALDTFTLQQNQPDASSVFCSELAAILWQRMGWLGENIPPNEYTPADFAGSLPAKAGVDLHPLIFLKGSLTAPLSGFDVFDEVNED